MALIAGLSHKDSSSIAAFPSRTSLQSNHNYKTASLIDAVLFFMYVFHNYTQMHLCKSDIYKYMLRCIVCGVMCVIILF